MPVNVPNKVIFFHICKTGGSSINHSVLWTLANTPIRAKDGYMIAAQHFTPKLLLNYKMVTPSQMEEFFKFCIVRNPWDRLVSAYTKIWHTLFNSFEEYIESVSACVEVQESGGEYLQTPRMVSRGNFRQISGSYNSQFRPQHLYLEHDGKEVMDFVGRFENYNEDVGKIYEMIGIDVEIKHINQSKNRKHYSEYYTDKTKNIVGDIYQKDIELLKYEF